MRAILQLSAGLIRLLRSSLPVLSARFFRHLHPVGVLANNGDASPMSLQRRFSAVSWRLFAFSGSLRTSLPRFRARVVVMWWRGGDCVGVVVRCSAPLFSLFSCARRRLAFELTHLPPVRFFSAHEEFLSACARWLCRPEKADTTGY